MPRLLTAELLDNRSTIVGALRTVFQETDLAGWTAPALQGVLGHAFNFNMRPGAGEVWQENFLDFRGGFFESLPDVAQFRVFQARQAREEGDFVQLKTDAWEAVCQRIDKGLPAIAWQPMSPEQKESGIRAGGWGLLVGYDEADETYSVRHQYHEGGKESFTVRYDAIGHSDPSEWLCVMVFEGAADRDPVDVHTRALQNAVASSTGTRSDSKDYLAVEGRGFSAYELWRSALVSEEATAEDSKVHAFKLVRYREHAAAYLTETADTLTDVSHELRQAADAYNQEVESGGRMESYCADAEKAGGFTSDSRNHALTILDETIQAEKDAIQAIKNALSRLG